MESFFKKQDQEPKEYLYKYKILFEKLNFIIKKN